MILYRHELHVTVLSSECSPDKIEKRIEASFRNDWRPEESICATTDTFNRAKAPAIEVANAPVASKFGTSAEYFVAFDAWVDSLPTAQGAAAEAAVENAQSAVDRTR